jgi:hypothetical protein
LVVAGAQGRAQADQQDRDVLQVAAFKAFSDSRGDVLGMPFEKYGGAQGTDIGNRAIHGPGGSLLSMALSGQYYYLALSFWKSFAYELHIREPVCVCLC